MKRLFVPALLAAACASLPLPYTSVQLALDSQRDPSKVLVHYLSQPQADAQVCDLRRKSDRLARVAEDTVPALLEAMDEGRVLPPLAAACLDALLASGPPQQAERWLDDVLGASIVLAERKKAVPADTARLAVLADVVARRPIEVRTNRARGLELEAATAALTKEDPRRPAAARVVELLGMELGRYRGADVSAASLLVIDDDAALLELSARLPDEALRTLARRRAVEVRIARSRFEPVRTGGPALVDRVLAQGRNPVDLRVNKFVAARLNLASVRGVLVRQDVETGYATLLGFGALRPQISVVSEIPLRGALELDVSGLALPITLCAPPEALSPEPCVDPAMLAAEGAPAGLDARGVLRFNEHLPLAQLGALARNETVDVTLKAGDQRLTTLSLPLWFETPGPLQFVGGVGAAGPAVKVEATVVANRVWFSVEALGRRQDAVVEQKELELFSVVSRGGSGSVGYAGSTGSTGSMGSHGMSASCPGMSGGSGGTGGTGGRGGNGGPGGNGGDGGAISVRVNCDGDCRWLRGALGGLIRSEAGSGGPGGAGGHGGAGGQGGSGGSGTSCYVNGRYTSVGGGSSGMQGSAGPSGSPGSNGAPGKPGRVTFL